MATFAALPAPVLAAVPAATDPFAGARVVILENGLTLVMRPEASRPVVAVQMLYKVGARNETPGITGIAHFLEHMLFRGTRSFGLADVTGVIERAGGEWHGYTYLDCTTYFQAAPKSLLPALLHLEAERMTEARMAEAEVNPERGAIFQEYRGYQLDARSDLFDAAMAALFLQHPYRNNTMGWESDLAGITHADLKAFYRRFYGPRNAVLAIAGDFDPQTAEAETRRLFGAIPAGGDDTTLRTIEPPLEGPRRLTLRRQGASPALSISFQAPPPSKAHDYAALIVLDAILSGAKGLSFYAHSSDLTAGASASPGTIFGNRLGAGPAESLGSALVPTTYPYHYALHGTPREGHDLSEVEALLLGGLRDAAGVSADDIASARRRIAAALLLESDALVEVTHELAFWTALGGIDLRRQIVREIDSITPDDVRVLADRLARGYAVTALVLPDKVGPWTSSGEEMAPPSEPRLPRVAAGIRPVAAKSARASGTSLPGAGRAIVDARPGLATFVLRVAAPVESFGAGGGARAGVRGTAAGLTADRSAGGLLAERGVSLTVVGPDEGAFADRSTLRIQMAGPAAALAEACAILAPAIGRARRHPPLEANPSSSNPAARVLEALSEARPSGGDTVPGGGVSMALVSPFTEASVRSALAGIASALGPGTTGVRGDASGSGRSAGTYAATPFAAGRRTLTLPQISQGRLLLAIPGDSDVVAQEAVVWLLHHNYSGRLGARAIADLGLVYDMDSESLRGARPMALFTMGADPSALPKLESALAAVLDASIDFSEEEVAAFRSFAAGSFPVRLADPVQAARLWSEVLKRGEDERGPEQFVRKAAGLTRERVNAAAARMLSESTRLTIAVTRDAGAVPADTSD